ncbi:MAG: pilin [Patescibacteria group bacterium]|nr:pilin [Patescibacteria group bacterium]
MNFKFKKRISLFLVLFFACLIIILPLLQVEAATYKKVTGGLSNPLQADSFSELIEDIIDWIADIGILIAVGMIIYSGVLFMIAGGSDEKITTAKKTLMWSLVGLAVLLIGRNWISLVESILGG